MKGLTIYGSSRSITDEFKTLTNTFQYQEYQRILERLLPHQNELIRSTEDLEKTLSKGSKNKDWEKISYPINGNNIHEKVFYFLLSSRLQNKRALKSVLLNEVAHFCNVKENLY